MTLTAAMEGTGEGEGVVRVVLGSGRNFLGETRSPRNKRGGRTRNTRSAMLACLSILSLSLSFDLAIQKYNDMSWTAHSTRAGCPATAVSN